MTRIVQYSRSAVRSTLTLIMALVAVMGAVARPALQTLAQAAYAVFVRPAEVVFDYLAKNSLRALRLMAEKPTVHRFHTRGRITRYRFGMIRIDTTALTQDQLQAASTPASALEGETIAYSFWDTQTYPSGGQQTLTFFQTVQT